MKRESEGKHRLVIVEDYKLVRIGLRMVLDADPDLQVVGEGDSGEQALALLNTITPDLILLDLGLPDMDGFQLIQEIRRFNRTSKILILSSQEAEEPVLKALAIGVNAYCLKDILSQRLVEVVKMVCGGATWLDPRVASRALQRFSHQANQHALSSAATLSEPEREILRLIVEGVSHTHIAQALDLNPSKLKCYLGSILQKLSAFEGIHATPCARTYATLF
jgi:DNA-binding NarL/FixJ family response regulator